MLRFLLCLGLAGSPLAATAQTGDPLIAGAKVAFLGLTFIDTSAEGDYGDPRADEAARLEMLEETVRERFAAEGFSLLPLDPVVEALEATVNPADCYGCDVRMGEKLGAEYVLVGEVQKVSNLILSMNLVMRHVPDGEMARGMSVEIRSNTDDSWRRGMTYILKNHFFRK